MNRLIQCKTTILPLLIAGVLACFGLLPSGGRCSRTPDGGYPGFNTAEGRTPFLVYPRANGTEHLVGPRSGVTTAGIQHRRWCRDAFNKKLRQKHGQNQRGALVLQTLGDLNTAIVKFFGGGGGGGGGSLASQKILTRPAVGNIAWAPFAGSNVTTATTVIAIELLWRNVSASSLSEMFVGAQPQMPTAIPVLIDPRLAWHDEFVAAVQENF